MNRQFVFSTLMAVGVLGGSFRPASAEMSGGSTLLRTPGARAAALGEAYTGATDDITAFAYNPASLQTLRSGHASFLFERGLSEDSFGQILLGAPRGDAGWGLSVGFYDGGDISLYDGAAERNVTSQRDVSLSIGYAKSLGDHFSMGFSGKYLSSELAEEASASTFAADLGIGLKISPRLHFGAAAQNLGGTLRFAEKGDQLPRLLRSGVSYTLGTRAPSMLFVDAAYLLNEAELRPAVGAEVVLGIIPLRAAYKIGRDLEGVTIGTGLKAGDASFDYSFGFVQKLDAQHNVSASLRFGRPAPAAVHAVRAETRVSPAALVKNTQAGPVTRIDYVRAAPRVRQIYVVQRGDSLAGIAKKFYGRAELWPALQTANRHLISKPEDVKVGQKIIIP